MITKVLYIKHIGNGRFLWVCTDHRGQIVEEVRPYPVEYAGSVVPFGFVCPCGGSVRTEWLYYYGPELHPQDGEWGGKCTKCTRTFTVDTMYDILRHRLPV